LFRSRFSLLAAFSLLACFAFATSAQAVHWPFFGGDNGRSGYQPVDEGTTPVKFLYKEDAAPEQFIKTSIVTTTGPPTAAAAAARFAFGTRDGVVQIRRLLDGAPIGPATGTDISSDDDAFGTRGMAPGGNGSSVSFADTSGPTGLGQLFAAHNDDSKAGDANPADIEIAQFDELTGDLVQQIDVQGTDGFTIQSSLLATGPAVDDPATPANETGNRALFFVASNGADQRLFRVAVTNNASSRAAVISATATNTGDIDATPFASPTIVFLRNPNMGNAPMAFVAVGTDQGLETFAAGDLVAGRMVLLDGPGQTPSVPIQPSGLTPNPGAGNTVTSAPFIYVASDRGGATTSTTTVYKITGNTTGLTVVSTSAPLAGDPAPALATDQESEATIDEAKVIVTTGSNLFLLSTDGLNPAGQFDVGSNLAPGSTGFQQTTAAASGDFIYVTNDQAEQLVLRLSDAKRVSAAEFTPDAGATARANTGVGQPSISRGFVQYSGGRGAFVYRNTDDTPPTVNLTAPADGSTVSGTVTLSASAFDARGIEKVAFALGGNDAGTDTTGTGADLAAPGAVFSVDFDTTKLPDGTYRLDAVATDRGGLASPAAPRTIRIDNPDKPGTTTTTPGQNTNTVVVPRRARGRFAASLTPARDRTRPWRFTTRGTLTLPSGLSRSLGCFGVVSVQVKAGTRTISTRLANLRSNCTFSSTVSFNDKRRFSGRASLKFTARFAGNQFVFPITAKSRPGRVR